MTAIHITDIESAINFWRRKSPSGDDFKLAAPTRALAEVFTVIDCAPGVVRLAAGITADNSVSETNVVVRFVPFQRTCEPETNPEPVTVTVVSPTFANTFVGLMPETVGAG